jgi:cobalt ECF transporter T component CbiQ
VEFSVSPSLRRHRSQFIERALIDINQTLEQSLYAETIARRPGLLQRIDARVKMIGLFGSLLAVNLSHSVWVIIALYAASLILAIASKIPLFNFIKRVWLVVVLFTFIIAIPALFITPGPALVNFPWGWVITQTGMMSALFLILRVGTSVSFAVLFVLTTSWHNILKAMGVMHMPDVIILAFEMTYRYIHLLLHAARDMFLSRKSRVLRRLESAEERRLVAATSGVLLGKSLYLSEEIFLAMQARGYRNYPHTMQRFQMERRDWIAVIILIVCITAATWLGRLPVLIG